MINLIGENFVFSLITFNYDMTPVILKRKVVDTDKNVFLNPVQADTP